MLLRCGGGFCCNRNEKRKKTITQVIQSIWIQHPYTLIRIPFRMHLIRNIHRHHHYHHYKQPTATTISNHLQIHSQSHSSAVLKLFCRLYAISIGMQKSARRQHNFDHYRMISHSDAIFYRKRFSTGIWADYFVNCILFLAKKNSKNSWQFPHWQCLDTWNQMSKIYFLHLAERKIGLFGWMIDFVYTDRCAMLMCISENAATFFAAKIWRLSNLKNMVFLCGWEHLQFIWLIV